MAATLFQASREGQLQIVKDILAENKPDIEAQDSEGFTALMLAARAGHVQVVQELLSSGAKPQSALEQDFSKSNAQISSMLSSAAQSKDATGPAGIDPQGGTPMPDGSVDYSQAQQQQYQYQPQQHQFFDPTQAPAPADGSAANLPPPDVARMIPCKFFPNCRYGEKCIFAHPVAMGTSASGPVSPGQGPVFYQPPPSYGYPPYGPPQHFYSMAPPMPIQYAHAGVPMPVHLPPPPHMAQGEAFGFQSQAFYPPGQNAPGYTEPPSDASDATAAKPEDAPSTETAEADKTQAETSTAENDQGKPVHRRQSFNSFLHHHAIPFQPTMQAPLNPDGSVAAPQQPFPRASKGPRRGGASMGGTFSRQEFNKRAERPACYFFARGVCKHGEECRFPHILADGTDARGPNAGRSNASIDASRAPNRALAAKNGRNGSSQNGNNAASSSGKKAANAAANKEGASSSAAASSDSAAPVAAAAAVETSSSASTSADKAAPATKQTDNKESKDKAAQNAVPASAPAAAASAPATSASTEKAASATKDAAASAPIPAKPATAANGASSAQRPAAQQQGNKKNGTGAKIAQQGANGSRQAFGKPAKAQAAKKVSQRVPDLNDFPALAGGPSASAATAAPVTGSAQKVNFSAILSAPAPVRAKPSPAAEEPESEKTAEAAADKPSATTNGSSAPDFATVAQAKAVAV